LQQIDGALGVALLGTIFFGQVEDLGRAPLPADFAHAAVTTQWVAVGMVVVAGALLLLLPKRATRHAEAH